MSKKCRFLSTIQSHYFLSNLLISFSGANEPLTPFRRCATHYLHWLKQPQLRSHLATGVIPSAPLSSGCFFRVDLSKTSVIKRGLPSDSERLAGLAQQTTGVASKPSQHFFLDSVDNLCISFSMLKTIHGQTFTLKKQDYQLLKPLDPSLQQSLAVLLQRIQEQDRQKQRCAD